MTEINGIYAIFLLISIGIILYLTYYSWNKRSDSNTNYFSFLMYTISKWMTKGALEMTFFIKVLWSQFTYLGIVFVWPFGFLFHLSTTTDQGFEGNNKFGKINRTNYYWFNKRNYRDDS